MTFKELVNKLTGWQRNQWARAGYPGLRREEVDKVVPYTSMNKYVLQESKKIL